MITQQLIQHVEFLVLYVLLVGVMVAIKLFVDHSKKTAQSVKAFIDAHTTEKERLVLKELVHDAVPYVRQLFPELAGDDFVKKAADHVAALALQKGIDVNEAELQTAVTAVSKLLFPSPTNQTPAAPAQPAPQATA